MLKGWLLSAGLFLSWEVGQVLLFHSLRPMKKFAWMTWLFAPTVPLLMLLYWITPADLWILPSTPAGAPLGILNALLLHTLLYCTHVMFFFHFDRSMTLRILCELEQTEGRFLSVEQLRKKYGEADIIGGRLRTLVANSYAVITHGEGRYRLTSKGELLAKGILLARIIIRVKNQ